METNNNTIAERIESRFDHDGMAFQPRSVHLQGLCKRVAEDIEQDWSEGRTTYTFSDGSGIYCQDFYWDVV